MSQWAQLARGMSQIHERQLVYIAPLNFALHVYIWTSTYATTSDGQSTTSDKEIKNETKACDGRVFILMTF